MREALLESIECPVCRCHELELDVARRSDREIREGEIGCLGCRRRYPIRRGIVDLLPDPSAIIRSEQKGWVEMLGRPPEAEMVENMLLLPYHAGAIWETTAANFDHALALMDVEGKSVLDVGAGRCWSSRRIALAGASQVLALDILLERFIGLETGDIYLERDSVYFDRALADMHRLPVRDGGFDVVFMSGTLHHSSHPGAVAREAARVLKPGGFAVITNEPVRGLFRTTLLDDNPELDHGINENVYTIWTYLLSMLRAGLRPWFFFPRSIDRRLQRGALAEVRQELGQTGYRVVSRLWQRGWGRALLRRRPLLALVYTIASMPLVMIAFKR